MEFFVSNFEANLVTGGLGTSCEIAPDERHWAFTDQYTNVGSINGLVPSGKQAITRTNVDPYLCRHMASLGRSELIK